MEPPPDFASPGAHFYAPQRPVSPEMRAYRACLHCRSRKTRCDLTPNKGQPPCKRCMRENRHCILGESHRGGRRERKKPKLDDGQQFKSDSQPPPLPVPPPAQSYGHSPTPGYQQDHSQQLLHQPNHDQYLPSGPHQLPPYQQVSNGNSPYIDQPRPHPYASNSQYGSPSETRSQWQDSTPAAYVSPVESSFSKGTHHTSPTSSSAFQRQVDQSAIDPKLSRQDPVLGSISIVSADLQNPSDALNILARAASDDDSNGKPTRSSSPQGIGRMTPWNSQSPHNSVSGHHEEIKYKPIADGLITRDAVYNLLSAYEKHYHPYFPIVPRETFQPHRFPRLSRTEPHLFSAILTVASKENELVHRICYDHMQKLVYNIMAGSDAGVEAVTALLLLSQWVSHEPKAEIAVGRGEEDRVSWMYIGTALRLGYFLGIDRTAFRGDENKDDASFRRKRLVWASCYVCDRLVSVRLGKGFWARGPGPLSGLRSKDFPDLQASKQGEDNLAEIFQANLELTQIFSNVHDILYSSKGHGWKHMMEGRYAKHLDDFRTSIRNWDDTWRKFECSAPLKESLNLSYHYLRLYVNAFAYQATISRTLIASKESQSRAIPLIGSATPDARFIFEAIDAAKDLIIGFNVQVSPETLRYMPCQYYLYIIYSAVFLYKARSTTTMSDQERLEIHGLVEVTIDRLEKSSSGAINMGRRYARLLKLLWRRRAKRTRPSQGHKQSIDSIIEPPPSQTQDIPDTQIYDPPQFNGLMMANEINEGVMGNGFSWLDLPGAWSFANQNNSASESAGDMDDLLADASSAMGSYDVNTHTMHWDNPNLIF